MIDSEAPVLKFRSKITRIIQKHLKLELLSIFRMPFADIQRMFQNVSEFSYLFAFPGIKHRETKHRVDERR